MEERRARGSRSAPVKVVGEVVEASTSEREYPEKHQTKQANEDDEQEDWAQKETFSVEVCQRWNRGDKVQLEDESGFRLCCELVILCTGKAAPQGKEGNIASDKVR